MLYIVIYQLRIAHVCDATLTKRLIEFENTESGSLTVCFYYIFEVVKTCIGIPTFHFGNVTSIYEYVYAHKDLNIEIYSVIVI